MSSRHNGRLPGDPNPASLMSFPQHQPPPPPYDSSVPAIQGLSLGHEDTMPGSYPTPINQRADRGYVTSAARPSASLDQGSPRDGNRTTGAEEDDTDDRKKIHIAVMGVTGSGKSNFIQLCTGSKNVKVGHSLRSCTNEVGEHEFVWRDKHICLIDTPGFDDTTRTDREVLDDIAAWLGTAYQDKIELTGILYLQRITDPRMGGIAFDNLKMFKKLCGKNYYPRVTLATTMWDLVKAETAESREAELLSEDDFWRDMRRNGCRVDRHYGDRESAMDILKAIIRSRNSTDAPTFVQVQKEMVDDNLSLEDTSAGKQINAKIEEERIKLQKQWQRAKEEMEESMKEHDEHMAQLYRKRQEELETKLARGYEDQEKMKVELSQLQEQQMRHLEQVQSELERTRMELQASRDELEQKRIEAEKLDPNDPRAQELQQEIHQTEDRLDHADEELAAQEALVNQKKKKWYNRLGRWAKENPDAIKTATTVALQIASEVTSRIRQRQQEATKPDFVTGLKSAYQQTSQRYGPSFESQDPVAMGGEGSAQPEYNASLLDLHSYSARGSFHDD